MKVSYDWLGELVHLTLNAKELAERLTMAGFAVDAVERLGDDHILDIDLTSNRPDALSHYGIAREAALICGTESRRPRATFSESDEKIEEATSVKLVDADLCPRFTARVVRGVKVGPSPKWLVDRLESIGQRSVNNIADVTNLVMYEMGQPTHAFDLNLLDEKRIVVRRARAGEQIKTLDGFTRELAREMLVIADASRAVAVAGVMGGEETEINEQTRDVLIESAYFNPMSIRHTARRLGLETEASYRFSRGADYGAQLIASERVAQLIVDVAGGRVLKGFIDVCPAQITRDPVTLRQSRIERLTGLDVSIERAADILRALEFEVELSSEEKQLRAAPPSFRVDIYREEDLVEEVARHVGYDLVDETLPAWGGAGSYLPNNERRRRARRALVNLGFDEAYTFSFINGERDRIFRPAGVETPIIMNPIDVNQSHMRGTLLTGLMDSLQHNFNQGQRDVKLFEIGRIFESVPDSERPAEREMLAFVMTGSLSPDAWRERRAVDFYDLKGAVETLLAGLNLSGFTIERSRVEYLHPGQSASLSRGGVELARFGRLHPRIASQYKLRQPVYLAELEFEKLLVMEADKVRYSALPKLPSTSRDVSALVPDDAAWGDIESAIAGLAISEIASVKLFDTFKGKDMPEGYHSLAFRVTYRGDGRTLTDEEVNSMHERVRGLLQTRFKAQRR
jgi:phenylalanyl-tRNA synthetase beta chain